MSAAAAAAAAAAATVRSRCTSSSSSSSMTDDTLISTGNRQLSFVVPPPTLSRYESQKRRDWNTFGQYLKNHRPPLCLSRCSGANVLEFLRYLDQFGKTKVHTQTCPFFGYLHPPAPCPCPLKQAWGSLDALIGRLRAAFEENGGHPETNPFGARAVRLYLREVRESQAKARGIAYEKKKRKKPQGSFPSSSPSHSQSQSVSNSSHMIMGQLETLNEMNIAVRSSKEVNYQHQHGDETNEAMIMAASSSDARGSMVALSVFN